MGILKISSLLLVVSICESANILYIRPFTAKSHYLNLKPIGTELARRGHNVTVITGVRDENPVTNYRQIMIDQKEIWDVIGGGRPNVFETVKMSDEKFHKDILWAGGLAFTELVLNSTEVQAFLAEDNKFDLVISENFFQEALNILAHKYNAPLVFVTTYGNCMKHNIVTRNPLQLATTVFELIQVKEPSSFWGRLRNLYFTVYEFAMWKYWYLGEQEYLVKKYIKNLKEPVPSLYEMQERAVLTLLNAHFSFDPPTAYLPNIVEIGGIHLTESNNKLPEDLQKLLDESKHGVVYVNFGSNIRSSELPPEKKNAFMNVFRKLKHTVFWKWEEDTLENKPDNLVVRKWFPQKEILTHPNIKVFISHGGLIGTQEAIFNGIPIVGIPIFTDQYNNLLQVQNHGFGKILEYDDINESTLEKLLNEVLLNDSYREKAKEMSKRFKDRPMTPLDTAMFWIEYVIRNKGTDYMRNPAINLSWIEYNMLDVYAFILAILIASLLVVLKVVKLVLNVIKRKESTAKDTSKRNKKKRN